ncbi:hypothetical protein C8J56DRAFT_769409 [Mycena floridula]|nr:hypothetical protein C8J56DRAFT_769409 [Mycena floridula]
MKRNLSVGLPNWKHPSKKNRLIVETVSDRPKASSGVRHIETPTTEWNLHQGKAVERKYNVKTVATGSASLPSSSVNGFTEEVPDLTCSFDPADNARPFAAEEDEEEPELLVCHFFGDTSFLNDICQRSHRDQLLDWRRELPAYLEQLFFLDGRGQGFTESTQCAGCNDGPPQYQCPECWTSSLFCDKCIVERHKEHPLHRIEFWTNEGFFVKVPLRKLGLRVQMGHRDGSRCIFPTPSKGKHFTIVDVDCVHEVSLDFCGCGYGGSWTTQLLQARLYPVTSLLPVTAATFAALDHFQMLSFESKMNLHDYYGTILRQTDNMDLKVIPVRKDQLRLMVREWRHLHMIKRSGCGHDPSGVEEASNRPGALALKCPACPHTEINLPPGWRQAAEEKSFLYALYIGMDANFKLKRKGVSSEAKDPSLSDGAAYFVAEKPYQEYLEKYKDIKQEPSKCVSHDAVNNADTKDTRGLVVTGAGAVDCTRHDFKLPASMGDLQFGERYLNMDFCLWSTLTTTMIALIYLSYDIMCQYSINFRSRMQRFPEDWSVNTRKTKFKWLIPKFHLPAHIPKCHRQFSFNFIRGSGRTEGEAVERAWSKLNPLAWSMKEMGPETRRDTLNDHIGHSNWKKIGNMGEHRLEDALTNHQRSGNGAVDDNDPLNLMTADLLTEWRKEVEAWEADPESAQNPFEPRVNAPTVASVRLALAHDDAKELDESLSETLLSTAGPRRSKKGQLRPEISERAMIAIGLELEDIQRKLSLEFKVLGLHSTDVQRRKLIEKSNTLRRRIMGWFEVQVMHVPGIAMLRAKDAASSSSEEGLPDFRARLWLPSDIGDQIPCNARLQRYEWDLREAQANDALEGVRSQLMMNSFLVKRKIDYASGVRENTRSNTTIQNTTNKMRMHGERYRVARKALWKLRDFVKDRPASFFEHFKELKDEDCKAMPIDVLKVGEGKTVRVITWIWTALGTNVSSTDKTVLLDAMRIQWLKYRARAMRWEEEVELVLEEMRRVNVFLLWKAASWRKKGDDFVSHGQAVDEGAKAYALRQAAMYTAMERRNGYLWRFVDDWVKSEQVPTVRRWYANLVRPRDAPSNIFY